MDTQRLKTLYEDQLAADLRPPVAQSVKRRETGAILRASCATPGGELREVRHAAVWLWSDLHLGHAAAIHVFRSRGSRLSRSTTMAAPSGRVDSIDSP